MTSPSDNPTAPPPPLPPEAAPTMTPPTAAATTPAPDVATSAGVVEPIDPRVRPDSDKRLGLENRNPADIGFLALLREDLATHDGDLFSQGFWAIAVHRFGNWRMGIGNKLLRLPFTLLYKVLYKLVEWTCGISLAYTVKVGRRVHIWHHGGMILGAREIGNDVHIRQNTTFGVARRGDGRWMKPILGDRVDVGTGAVVVGPIRIGADAKIGANAVVMVDVPPGHIAVGVPAVIKPPKKKPDAAAPASDAPPTESPAT